MTQPAERTAPPRRAARSRSTLLIAAALMVIAFLPFALVFLRPVIETRSGSLDIGEVRIDDIDGGLKMVSPTFSGRTENDEPFTITADWALPDSPRPTKIALENVVARIEMRGGRIAALSSHAGIYFPDREFLELSEGVSAETSDGYTMQTQLAQVDLAAKRLTTPEEIRASGPRGSIRADAMEALDAGGRIVIFRGNVRVRLLPETATGANE